MKMTRPTRMTIAAAAASVLALAIAATPASAAVFTLGLSSPTTTPVVGKPIILTATGTMPADEIEFPYWFSLDAIATSVTSTCPPDRWEGVQFVRNAGGSIIVLSQREVPDGAGNFSIPVAATPSAPGAVLLCGYTDDGLTTTLASTSLILNIQPAPSTPVPPTGSTPVPPTGTTPVPPSGSTPVPPKGSTPAGPRPVSIPEQARRGIRSCIALLGRKEGRGCISNVVRKANTACRRLHTRTGRAGCLRDVRRIARKYS